MCAVIKRGILGGFQNKIANVVGGSWKGISYMRSLPISVANPRTSAQTLQRDTFKNTVQFAVKILTTVIKPLWDRFAQYESGYNAFVSVNIGFFDDLGLSEVTDLVISKGTLATMNMTDTVLDASASTLVLTWDPTPSGDANPSDTAYAVVYNTVTKDVQGFDTQVARSVGTSTSTVDIALTAGNNCYVFVAMRKADGTKASNTEFTPCIVSA